ncbi:MAG: hypothetical protein A2632_00645 [Candidatus Pacebacteria bacterium RIFCSPHIGHO2_01_FULL_46_16]|nr:MAG: hypothetical protein A2632_00645 [Candidatus Pacebacteria bacterium RIFCSPHIGHO2_01_FULL_46_16]OGJ21700.1 MAG: hypothetical protein A3J60_03630 [Candidatus Pacebacteria bacterium RIFCSPHIGHO2_02_FULL_46_9]OGJ38695.1 MAG: hypothetical protein A3A82_03120 [Candidatus Pacebacteria bacterium RIFCSPLOWO2_01_FULL_47_12]
MQTHIPTQVKQYFWGDNLEQLSWDNHRDYIIQTILEKGDSVAAKWVLQKTKQNELLSLIPKLKLSEKSRNFWLVYLS